jgi:T-complex protein 1 subunit eta
VELELKAERDNAEIRLDNPEEYQRIVDAEWKIIYEKLDRIIASGAKVILSKLPVGDLATQYFADRGLFCAGRVPNEDLNRLAKATGGTIQTTVTATFGEDVLGSCGKFEEVQLGSDRYNMFTQCTGAKSVTLVLRGGAEQYIEETERSLNDAIMIVRRAVKAYAVVAGGGAIEMELSRHLRQHLRTVTGKHQLVMSSFAKALECIPRQLADNSGMDATNVLNKLRQHHQSDDETGRWFGVDVLSGKVDDLFQKFVWEPEIVRINVISAATEAACTVLSVDQTIRNPKTEQQQEDAKRAMQGRGRGMAGRGGMGRPMRGRGGR